MKKKRIIIIGATSGMAEHCARLWLKEGPCSMTLVGRDEARTERVANDLRVRSPESDIDVVVSNFIDYDQIEMTVDTLATREPVDIALIAHGWLPNQEHCQEDLMLCRDSLEINGISPCLFAEAFTKHFEAAEHGTLAVIGSVAGDRGRRKNYIYGAAKGLVNRYVQGLQHRFAGTGVKVVLIKPGPTDTPMTADEKRNGAKLASVECVAKSIVNGIAKGKAVVYAPAKWWLIMMVIRHIPNFIFNKMNV